MYSLYIFYQTHPVRGGLGGYHIGYVYIFSYSLVHTIYCYFYSRTKAGIYLFGFRWFVRVGGGSTAAAVTLDTVADESRDNLSDGVARSPSRLWSRDWKICCYGDALSAILCLLVFWPCFVPFVFRFSFFSFFPFSSVQQPSATLSTYVFFSTCSFCLSCHLYYPISELFRLFIRIVFVFFVALFSRVAFFFGCALVPGTLALDLSTLVL